TIRNLAAYEYPEENFVAGINADFFNMSTGVPESAYIRNGELYTTDRDSFCLAETEQGTFFIDKPQISLTLTSAANGTEYTVLHLNKEFSEYGLYLYNARYSPTTHITKANTAVKMYPYTESADEAEFMLKYAGIMPAWLEPAEIQTPYSSELADGQTVPAETETEFAKEPTEEDLPSRQSELLDTEQGAQAAAVDEETPAEEETLADEQLTALYARYTEQEPDSEQALSLRQQMSERLEELSGYRKIGERYYLLCDVFPQMGAAQQVVVADVNAEAGNESIPKDAYLLCADNSSYGYLLMAFQVGDTFTLNVAGNENFYSVVNAVGTGTVIVKDSEPVDDRTFSHYLTLQPRSAVGIRADGSLVLYASDGRQSGYSAGLKLYDLAERMVSLGCVYAANLDGGGSTAVNASLPGYDSALTVNSPSDKTERRISNAIVFTNSLEKEGTPYAAYAYGDYYLTLSDAPISLGTLVYADRNGYSADFPKAQPGQDASSDTEESTLRLYPRDGKGLVAEDTLYPAGNTGVIEVLASFDGGVTENVAANVVSLAAPDTITLQADQTVIAPFETVSITASALYRRLNVASTFDSFSWSVVPVFTSPETEAETEAAETEETEETEENGEVGVESAEPTAEQTAEPINYGTVENGVFYPGVDGMTFDIVASHAEVTGSVRITVEAYPFADMQGHWAMKEIYALAKLGVVNGEYDASGTAYYLPERRFSRNEFCAMLERMTGIGRDLPVHSRGAAEDLSDSSAEESEGSLLSVEVPEPLPFADADAIPDWAYESVYRLYASGLLDGILHVGEDGQVRFAGSEYITRAEVIDVVGKICDAAPEEYTLADFIDLDDWQKADDSIKNAVHAGIFSGYEDMSLRLSNPLTRAEGAAVFTRLYGHLLESGWLN
ncbi:MAG: phosphodiester glycosidase family protein, partial [Eubacteriales bacterium]